MSKYLFYILFGLLFLYIKKCEAGFCTEEYDCESTCYETTVYKTTCFGRECYKQRVVPYVCTENCYRRVCCTGYTGLLCQTPLCFGSKTCQNDGKCVEPDVCECMPGYTGPSCADRVSACGVLPSISNGQFKTQSEFITVDQVATLECAEGYEQFPVFEPVHVHCNNNGLWSADHLGITCKLIDCGPPPAIQNGRIMILSNTKFGNQAVVQCDLGYVLTDGPKFSQCTGSGNWSIVASTCEPICGDNWALFEDSCYYFDAHEANYTDARELCLEMNATLVQIDSTPENDFLKAEMLSFNGDKVMEPENGFWNDLFESTTNGNEVWRESNVPLDPNVADWDSPQPDDLNGTQSCSMFWKMANYKWVDIECDAHGKLDRYSARFGRALCEKPKLSGQ